MQVLTSMCMSRQTVTGVYVTTSADVSHMDLWLLLSNWTSTSAQQRALPAGTCCMSHGVLYKPSTPNAVQQLTLHGC
jgi:hypothetical protein